MFDKWLLAITCMIDAAMWQGKPTVDSGVSPSIYIDNDHSKLDMGLFLFLTGLSIQPTLSRGRL